MKRTRPVKAKSKSPADSAALEVLREFVEDVKVAHGTGRGNKIAAAALDWPDLAATYEKAVAILKAAGDHKNPPRTAVTIIVEGGNVQSVFASSADAEVEIIDYDNEEEGQDFEKVAEARIKTLTPHAVF